MAGNPEFSASRVMPAWAAAAALILLPLLAGLATRDVAWEAADFPFVFVGAMLVVACATFELAARIPAHHAYRVGACVAVAAGVMLAWMNLAVGIIGNEETPRNLMYGGVLAVGVIGAILARFEAEGLARALVATALAQALVAALAQIAGHFTWIVTGFFVALWLASAWLFRRAVLARVRAQRP